tara:strand:+ start:2627 stop:2881 length:255 start_codon:yes stop_codon:yes gene_type:complete
LKIFIYKCLTGAVIFFILFQLTIGLAIREIEEKISSVTSQENLLFTKNKIRKELQNAIKKDRYLNEEDATLIKDFLNKIKSEIN